MPFPRVFCSSAENVTDIPYLIHPLPRTQSTASPYNGAVSYCFLRQMHTTVLMSLILYVLKTKLILLGGTILNVLPNGKLSSDIIPKFLSDREMKRSFLTEELMPATWEWGGDLEWIKK